MLDYYPARKAYAFYLAVRLNMSYAEIARRLGVSKTQVRGMAFQYARRVIGLPFHEAEAILYRRPSFIVLHSWGTSWPS